MRPSPATARPGERRARRVRGSRLGPIVFVISSACGGPPALAPLELAFQRHALSCEMRGLGAKLQIGGVEGFCPLRVTEDNKVSGLCEDVPAGGVRVFRLVYFVEVSGMEVELAVAIEMLDLREETRSTITLEFSSDAIETGFDDDGDRVSNLAEVCMGRNPLLFDQ